ncbi:PREDICTED: kelch-like protein 42 [Branchiostoma belcheri]|uniref:Kelch-like protein 42 n=1 Tax=Branchiostoma belcheri TaxID=7741 RepID=A0A6P4Y6C8_BRABE|nr:PREDICTED: kelch-like protein 42 [Branchiostoma belcheri]
MATCEAGSVAPLLKKQINRHHREVLFQNLSCLLKDESFSDVHVVVEGKRYAANRNVLAACSEYLQAIIESGMASDRPDVIELPDLTTSEYKALNTLVYEPELFKDHQVPDLVYACEKLQIPVCLHANTCGASRKKGAPVEVDVYPELLSAVKDDVQRMVMARLQTYRRQRKFSDICIRVHRRNFKAHKNVLAAGSMYFHTMFTCGMRESVQDAIDLKGVTAGGLRGILDFMYTSEIAIKRDNVQDVLAVASFLQVKTLLDACAQFLYIHLDMENCCDVLIIAEAYGLTDLVSTVYEFMATHIDPRGDEAGHIILHQLPQKHLNHLKNLPQQLIAAVSSKYIGNTSWAETPGLYYFSLKKDTWVQLTTLPDELRTTEHFEIAGTGGCIYIAGGRSFNSQMVTESKPSGRVFCFNTKTDSWTELAPLLMPRYNFALTAFDGHLYAIGGFAADSGGMVCQRPKVNCVECYNIETNTWEFACPLPTGVVNPTSTVCLGQIYLSAHPSCWDDKNRRLMCYDPDTNQWKTMKYAEWADMKFELSGMPLGDLVADHSHVYVVGQQKIATYNVISGEWTDCITLPPNGAAQSRNVKRVPMAMGGKIINFCDRGVVLSYNIKKNQWERLSAFPGGMNESSAIIRTCTLTAKPLKAVKSSRVY